MTKLLISTAALFFAALLAPNSHAETCTTAPSCSTLGYNETASSCRGKYMKCPFDVTKVMCLNDGPHVGDLKYSLYSSNHDGWLLCNGTQYSQTTYSKLYNVIRTNFCHRYTSRTDTSYTSSNCKSGYFAVPDYRGFFLRAVSTYNAMSNTVGGDSTYFSNALIYKGAASTALAYTSPYVPQYEQLPKITGEFGMLAGGVDVGWNNAVSTTNNAFYRKDGIGDNGKQSSNQAGGAGFDASRSNIIYDGTHVMPASYGAYVFIYAGE